MITQICTKSRQTVFCFFLIFFIACTPPEERDFNEGVQLAKEKNYEKALALFDRAIRRSPDSKIALNAAKEGARISFLDSKDFLRATQYLKLLVLLSENSEERLKSQIQLASIYFDQLTDYKKAIEEINKLLSTPLPQDERNQFKIKLAKAYFYTNNFAQAESEANDFLANEKEPNLIFQMMVLKGNVFIAKKDLPKAIDILKEVFKKYPEKAVKENAAITLAVAYEEMKDYKNAISVLEQMRPYHPLPEYVDLRIKRLQLEQKKQPGAKGLNRK